MKKLILIFLALTAIMAINSCKKDTNKTTTNNQKVATVIGASTDTLCGYIKGTLLSGKTYHVSCDVNVYPGDTLYVQSGVTVNVLNNSTFFIAGTIISEGTQTAPNTFTAIPTTTAGYAGGGAWGGFQCDSAKYVSFRWTHINYTGGPDGTGSPRRTILMYDNNTFILEDCWLLAGLDDGLRLQGPKVSILRNTIEHGGSTDGEAINLKDGATGDVAYNVVWSQAGSGIKLQTNATVFYPQTNVNVYNNTIVNSGFRRGAGEPGRGVHFDLFTKGNCYNNIICNVYYGLDITALTDTANFHYGNNLFYTTVDSTRQYFYPPASWGHAQSTDIISTGSANNNPMFVNLDANIANTVDMNNVHLVAGSPAIGHGNPTYNADMGAYPTNGGGNKH